MAANTSTTGTKSIDVGSMFLMDLSVHESELLMNSDSTDSTILDNDPNVFPGTSTSDEMLRSSNKTPNYNNNNNNKQPQRLLNKNNYYAINQSPSIYDLAYNNEQCVDKSSHQHEYPSGSLIRLANAIYPDGQCNNKNVNPTDTVGRHSNLVTIVEPQPIPEITEQLQSSPSLSDEGSFVDSSSGSSDSLSSSYTATSGADDEERGSTTTREDSGVLDMKDLDGQLNSYDNEHDVDMCHHNQQQLQQIQMQEKPISNDIKATNLINKSANNNIDRNSDWLTNKNDKPTNGKNSHHQHNHHNHNHHHNHHHHRNHSTRSMSASLPIQVPVRQMKKDLNKLKLDLIIKGLETSNDNRLTAKADSNARAANPIKAAGARDKPYELHNTQWGMADEFDEILEQEYNDNHQNHYPVEKDEVEQLRADENPMKLFESIQALARSLHKDAELFGSLPPKRMLESPIRSLALV